MKNIFIIILSFIFTTFYDVNNIIVDKEEVLRAFDLLNSIRTNPENYLKQFPFLKKSKVQKTKLNWNDTLALVAQKKAYDMAEKNYFNHIDPEGFGINYYINKSGYKLNPSWVEDKSANNFESLCAGILDANSSISTLIIDKNVPTLGHRTHLLGLNEWNASLKDIGIGFVKRESGSAYKTYTCIIIAKHDW